MGKRTHGPALLAAIDSNNHQKIHELLAIQVKVKAKVQKLCVGELLRLGSSREECPLILAATIPDPSILKYMAVKHGVDINYVRRTGSGRRAKVETPLLAAAKHGLHQTLHVLLSMNADSSQPDHHGRTALHHAIRLADYRMAKMLLARGAQANLQDGNGNSPLHTATKYGHVELVRLLLRYGGDLYRKGQYGAIPIHIAAKEGHVGLINLFVKHEVNINIKVPCYEDLREKAPLHVAAEAGHYEAVSLMAERLGADVGLLDSEGESPLHCAVINEYDPFGMKNKEDYGEVVKALVRAGANINQVNGRGETALHHAARNEFQKIVELLLIGGADPVVEDNDGNRPGDLVSEDDTVSKLALKRAAEDRSRLVKSFMEAQSRGGSVSSSQSISGIFGRANSNPVLNRSPSNHSLVYEDGYLLPKGSRPRLDSIDVGSLSGFRIDDNTPGKLTRSTLHGSSTSFASVASSTVSYNRIDNPYNSIDTDASSVTSDNTLVQSPVASKRPVQLTHNPLHRSLSLESELIDEVDGSDNLIRRGSLPVRTVKKSYPFDKPLVPPPRQVYSRAPQNSSSTSMCEPAAPLFASTPIHSEQTTPTKSPPCNVSDGAHVNHSSIKNLNSQDELVNGDSTLTNEDDTYQNIDELHLDSSVDRKAPEEPPRPPLTSKPLLEQQEPEKALVNQSSPPDPNASPENKLFNLATFSTFPTRHKKKKGAKTPKFKRTGSLSKDDIYVRLNDHQTLKFRTEDIPPVNEPLEPVTPTLPVVPLLESMGSTKPQVISSPIMVNSPQILSKHNTDIEAQDMVTTPVSTSFHNPSKLQIVSTPLEATKAPLATNEEDSDDSYFDDDSFDTMSEDLAEDSPEKYVSPTHDAKIKKYNSDNQINNCNQHGPDLEADGNTSNALDMKEKNMSNQAIDEVVEKPSAPLVPLRRAASTERAMDHSSQIDDLSQPPVSPPIVIRVNCTPPPMNSSSSPPKSSSPPPTPTSRAPSKMQDPKMQIWLDEQACLAQQRATVVDSKHVTHSDPLAQSTPPNSPRHKDINKNYKHQSLDTKRTSEARSSISSIGPIPRQLKDNFYDESPPPPIPPRDNFAEEEEDINTESTYSDSTISTMSASDENETLEDLDQCKDKVVSIHPEKLKQRHPSTECEYVSMNTNKTSSEVVNGRRMNEAPRHSDTKSRAMPMPGASEIADRFLEPVGNAIANEYTFMKSMAGVTTCSTENLEQSTEKRLSQSDLRQESLESPALPSSRNVRSRLGSNSSMNGSTEHMSFKKGISANRPVDNSPQLYATVDKSRQSKAVSKQVDVPSLSTFAPEERNGESEENPSPKRRVTIGDTHVIHEAKISRKGADQRLVTYNSQGKCRIAVIGGNADGIFIHRIDPGSEAEQKGLREGDQILKINGGLVRGRTKEEIMLQLFSLQDTVKLLVRYKKEIYDTIIKNGGMGDSFYVKALFSHTPSQKDNLKIVAGDVFSVRDTMPEGQVGSWRALKTNARPSEAQHGLIPNEGRAEQVALTERKKAELGSDKLQRGGFLRRSLRRSKSAERLNKETEALAKISPLNVGPIKAYEYVAQKLPGFMRPVCLLGLFCDKVRDQLYNEARGMFEKAPAEVEMPGAREEGGAKVPLNLKLIQSIVDLNRHCLMIVSPKSLQYLQNFTSFQPIVIYLNPGSKSIVKSLRTKLAPDFAKKSSFMYEEALAFQRQYNDIFTATVNYTLDESWFSLLKDTISRIQNQLLWLPTPRLQQLQNGIEEANDSILSNDSDRRASFEVPGYSNMTGCRRPSNDDTPDLSRQLSSSSSLGQPSTPSYPIPSPLVNILQKHATSDADTTDDNLDISMCSDITGMPGKPRNTALTYEGYFLSENEQRGRTKQRHVVTQKSMNDPRNMNNVNGGRGSKRSSPKRHHHIHQPNSNPLTRQASNTMPKSILKKNGSLSRQSSLTSPGDSSSSSQSQISLSTSNNTSHTEKQYPSLGGHHLVKTSPGNQQSQDSPNLQQKPPAGNRQKRSSKKQPRATNEGKKVGKQCVETDL